jgi:hypothetical protein
MVCRETSADYACSVILADSAAQVTKQLHGGARDGGSAVAILPVMRRLTAQVVAILWPDPTQPIRVFPVYVDMNINPCAAAKSFLTSYLQLFIGPLMLAFLSTASATDGQPYPEFEAVYDARVNGIPIAEVSFSLHKLDNGDFVYQQKSTSVGIASLFGKKLSTASSRWRLADNGIQALEYQSSDADGDADDNQHLIFNWKTAQVENVSTANPWQIRMPKGTLDKLLIQMVLIFELRDGSTEFQFPVAHRGRIKQYRFKQTGRERTELPMGEYDTLIVERLDDDRDKTKIWSAPQLNYFPVRFLKHKQSGIEIELSLRQVEFLGQQASD